MERQRYSFTFAVVLITVFTCVACIAYDLGEWRGKKQAEIVYPPICYGNVPDLVPIWAVYDNDGALVAVSALSDRGTLRAFNVRGGVVDPMPLDAPDAWFTMSAEWTRLK